MHRPTLNRVISGKSVLPGTLGKVAKALNVNVAELIDDKGRYYYDGCWCRKGSSFQGKTVPMGWGSCIHPESFSIH